MGRKPGERVLDALRERLDSALEDLEARGGRPAVHDARRKLKKARAYLRLARAGVPPAERRRLNELCRDAGRAVSGLRDAAALELAWRALRAPGPGGHYLARLRADAEASARESLERCRKLLKRARRRAQGLEPSRAGPAGLGRGYERSCERLHQALKQAQSERSDRALHEWRKRAKDLRYQLDLLDEPPRKPLGRAARLLKTLTDLLGDDHDLGMLGSRVSGNPDEFGGVEAAARLEAAVARRRRALRRTAFAVGRRWTAASPKKLARLASRSWN